MQIKLASIVADDRDKALHFHTDVLCFVEHNDIPMGRVAG